MYDIDLKFIKKGNKVFILFIIVGLLFVALFSWILVSNKIKQNKMDAETTSTRVEIKSYFNDEGSKMYSPIYYFEADGRTYSCASNSSSSKYPGNGNKKIYYMSNNPENCMSETEKKNNIWLIIGIGVPLLCIIIGTVNIVKSKKRIKTILELNKHGKLIKNLPYRLENSNIYVNNKPLMRAVVDYTLPSGSVITLFGDPRGDGKNFDDDGYVDLLIDENNPDIYFIDYEINRLTGNQPSDYYNGAPDQQAQTNQAQTPTQETNNAIATPNVTPESPEVQPAPVVPTPATQPISAASNAIATQPTPDQVVQQPTQSPQANQSNTLPPSN